MVEKRYLNICRTSKLRDFNLNLSTDKCVEKREHIRLSSLLESNRRETLRDQQHLPIL